MLQWRVFKGIEWSHWAERLSLTLHTPVPPVKIALAFTVISSEVIYTEKLAIDIARTPDLVLDVPCVLLPIIFLLTKQ